MKVAKEFLTAVEMLALHSGAPLRPSAHLSAQTLECALKAYIGCIDPTKLETGELRGAKGHELLFLWELAMKTSTAAAIKLTISTPAPDWVKTLAFFHAQPYLDRYPIDQGFMVHMRSNAFLADELGKLLSEVEAALPAGAQRRL